MTETTDFASFDSATALRWLYQRNQFSMKLGLDTIRALLDHLGRPEADLALVHVAGTNGKGSVCGNIAALLRAHGYARVGLYTSPHLVSFRERIRVEDAPLPRESLAAFLREHGPRCEALGATYFEITTALALDYFRKSRCEAVVLETGLGGRLDATNAVLPKVSVITPVDIDHVAQLGPTLAHIFAEKAAILKPGVPMVLAAQGRADSEPLVQALAERARSLGSAFIPADDHPWGLEDAEGAAVPRWVMKGRLRTWRLPATLRPERHQRDNLATACLAVEAFLEKSPPRQPTHPDDAALARFLVQALPTGRTQVLECPGRLPLVLDGAHNPHGLKALANMLETRFPGARLRILFAMMADKPVETALHILRGLNGLSQHGGEIRLVPLWELYPRAWKPETSPPTAVFDPSAWPRQPLHAEALREALRPGHGADAVVVCGSLYLIGEVIAALAGDYPELSGFVELARDRA